ncbi:MAG TPA: alpha/beta hydrolase [Blastocatellia bacterium]|nr:alpha/beta hydrolase [Blastocatellia bacterium]
MKTPLRRYHLTFTLAVAALFLCVTASAAQAQAQAAPATKVATVFGARIHYQESGSGPVVILLHGLGGDMSNWSMTVGALSQKYRVIVPDQVGFGRSDKPMLNYRVGTLVDFLDGFYKELKIERATLVGNSLGGWISAAFALAHPQKVDRVVLVDSAGFAVPKEMDARVINGLNPSTREAVRQMMPLVIYNKQLYASDAAIDMMFTRRVTAGDGFTIQRIIESILRGEDVLDNRLGELKHPTLVIWGREDLLTPLAMGERFKKEIPHAELIVFDKCGHVPQLEQPAQFNAALLKFLGAEVASK